MPETGSAFETGFLQRIANWLGGRQLKWLLLTMLVIGILAGHQTLGVMDRDEARFAQASKQMVQTGDIITPRYQDELRAKKPAGIYWLQSFSARIVGDGDIAAYRVPSLLGLIATLIMTYQLAGRFFPAAPAEVKLLSAGFLGSGLLILAEAHLAKTDSVLLFLCLWQQAALYRLYCLRHETGQRGPWLQFWVAMGLAILIKGPIAPALAGTTILGLIAFDRTVIWLKKLRAVRGLVILSVICLPWAMAVQFATDGAFLGIAIGGDFLPKLASGQESHGAPPGIYLLVLGLLFFPASLFLGWLSRLGWGALKADSIRFLVSWIAGYWIMIELIPTKLPHYILPVLPAFTLLLAAAMIAPHKSGKSRQVWAENILAILAAVAGVVLIGVLGWGASKLGGITGGSAFVFASIAGLIMVWVLVQYFRLRTMKTGKERHQKLLYLLAAGGLVNLVAIGGVVANLDRLHMSDQLARAVASLDAPPQIMAIAGYHEPSAVFTLGTELLLVDGTEAALLLAEAVDALVIVEAAMLGDFEQVSNKLGQRPMAIRQLEGVNMSRGSDITLHLFRSGDHNLAIADTASDNDG